MRKTTLMNWFSFVTSKKTPNQKRTIPTALIKIVTKNRTTKEQKKRMPNYLHSLWKAPLHCTTKHRTRAFTYTRRTCSHSIIRTQPRTLAHTEIYIDTYTPLLPPHHTFFGSMNVQMPARFCSSLCVRREQCVL
jgi:hypothetical protein